MSKILSALFVVLAAFTFAVAQDQNRNDDNLPSTGVAPKMINGVGRADVRVYDEQGNPIKDAYVKLESSRTDGFFCESWNNTDARGLAGLPPLHMGNLKFKIKAKGYLSQELIIPFGDLGQPIRITMKHK